MHACAALIGGEPLSVSATAVPAARFASVLLEFAGGQAAALNLWTGTADRSACRWATANAC